MCGLVGMISLTERGFFIQDKEMFLNLMFLNQLRGKDATGAFGTDKQRKVDFIKTTGGFADFDSYQISDKFYERISTRYLSAFGHARLATVGKNLARNAHPYVYPKITLIHNGVIRNFSEINKDKKIEVDSQYCAKVLEEEGLEALIKQIKGAFAFIWYDKDENKIRMLRNSERPLWSAITSSKDTLFFASEKEFLEFSAARSRNYIKEMNQLPVGELYSFTPGTTEMTTEKIDLWKNNVTVYHHPYSGYGYEGEWAKTTVTPTAKPVVTPKHLPVLVDAKTLSARYTMEVGKNILFIPLDIKSTNSKKHIIVEGVTYEDEGVSVRMQGLLNARTELLNTCDYVIGTIKRIVRPQIPTELENVIVYIDPKTIRLYIKEDVTEKPDPADKELIPQGYTLLDKTVITFDRYAELAEKGCKFCEGFIGTEHAQFVRFNNGGLLCATCSSSAEHQTSV